MQATDERYLREIAVILYEGDVSTFEIIHSGLITKLLGYLTSTKQEVEQKMSRSVRIQRFLLAFLGPLVSMSACVVVIQLCVCFKLPK